MFGTGRHSDGHRGRVWQCPAAGPAGWPCGLDTTIAACLVRGVDLRQSPSKTRPTANRTSCMSAVATARTTTRPCSWPRAPCGRIPVRGLRPPQTPVRPRMPDTSCPDTARPDTAVRPQSLRKQRTVNPLTRPTRYNFLYSSSRPACGRHAAARRGA
jgi:hypothetical protein